MSDGGVMMDGPSSVSLRPKPVITPETAPFWSSVRIHEMRLPQCESCARFFFPPSAFCPFCWSDKVTWTAVRGTGTIVSYVTFQRLYHPGFADLLPYSVAVVEMDEGPRLLGRVTGSDHVEVDGRVSVVYEDVDSETSLPLFQPSGRSS